MGLGHDRGHGGHLLAGLLHARPGREPGDGPQEAGVEVLALTLQEQGSPHLGSLPAQGALGLPVVGRKNPHHGVGAPVDADGAAHDPGIGAVAPDPQAVGEDDE